jgi:hypothetical protein
MKRHRLAGIAGALALAALGVVACFDDPTSSLQGGPAALVLTRSAVTVHTGDSVEVQAKVVDAQGTPLPIGSMTWESSDAAVAAVTVDESRPIPGGVVQRAFIRGLAAGGGTATVTVTSQGVSASFRVLNLPANVGAVTEAVVTGTAFTDTVQIDNPDGSVTRDIFSAGDTVTITVAAGSKVYFSATARVRFGPVLGYVIARTDSTVLKVVSRLPFRGRPHVAGAYFNGPADVGVIALDSLQTDSIVLARQRFRGGVNVVGDTLFVTPAAGSSFNATTSSISFGATNAIVIGRTTTELRALSPIDYSGIVTVRNVVIGLATLDSLKSPGTATIAKATFQGAINTGGDLLDTIKVYGTALQKFSTVAASLSNITIGGTAAWVLLRTADSMYVISKMPNSGTIAVSNVNVGGVLIPSLNSTANVVVNETPTGEPNEPLNDTPGAVTIDFSSATAANPFVLYGAIEDGTDWDDFFGFTLASARSVTIRLEFAGTGGGGQTNPDIDLVLCAATCNWATYPTGFVSIAGATGAQPENIAIASLPAGTYNIYVNAYDLGGSTRPYKLIVY